jgi:hypothetical protein
LYLPGVLVFSDSRLFELCGSLLLHGGTLIGLFILVRLAFTRSAARIAVLLYAFSPIGLFFANSLWPRGHPYFAVWFVVFTILWHRRRNAKYLAAALVTFAAGMYVFMEVAPLALAVVAVYCIYRPPFQAKWVLAAASVSLLIWLPYLRFEKTRGFRDIASLFFQVEIFPRDYGQLLCDPTLPERAFPAEETIVTRARGFVRSRPRAVLTGLLTNFLPYHFSFGRQPLPKGDEANRHFVLALLRAVVPRKATPLGRLALVAISVISAALLAAVAAVMVRVYQRRRSRAASGRNSLPTDTEKIVILALALPWAALLLSANPDSSVLDPSGAAARHYLFLWPLQTALLAYFVTGLLARWTVRTSILRAAQVALIAVVVVNPTVLTRLEDWRINGWAGADSDILRAVGSVAEQVHREGRNNAAVGYLMAGGGNEPFHAIDPRYRNGMDMDYVLDQRFGVRNSDRCPEGVSTADDYLIVQLGADPGPPESVRLRGQLLPAFQWIGRFGEYLDYARKERIVRD